MDDIVTRLRNSFAKKDYPMLQDHCESCAIPKEWGGHHDNCLYDQAADEIERLRRVNDRFCDDVKTWRKLALAEHWLRVPDHLACNCLDKWVRGEQ